MEIKDGKRRKKRKGKEKGAGKAKGKREGKRPGPGRARPDPGRRGRKEEKRQAVRREAICADAKQRRNARACTHETATGEDKPIDRKNETWKKRGRKRRDEERKDGGRYVIADAQVSE
ncbi:hypothetical protein WR25_27275 [Diploscapter pachys]|uniref:Uncharacterized protein n=1 Tax=Diploscapter pachys TaxID=2018661 RepID=A0A2A2JHH7_9BILA|nr:hypothetical protein WR25_27275 [Diploscapter pachys]